jgi:hypothetical protein
MIPNLTYLIRTMLLSGFVLLYTESSGQEAVVKLSTDQIAIGQQASLQFEVKIPRGSTLIWPALGDTITQYIEIVRFGRPDTLSKKDQAITLRQTHQITAWEEGYFPIPPLVFGMVYQGDTISFQTEPLLLQTVGVEIDPEAPPKDIKPLLLWPVTAREVLPYVLLVLLITGIVLYLYHRMRNRTKTEEPEEVWEKPDIPAHMAALSSLEGLRSKKLWQSGQLKAYHSELTDILRKYLKKRFAVDATEMTTAETLYAVQGHLKDADCREWLSQILSLADLVKFAKHQPDAIENESVLDQAIDLVQKTKHVSKDAD